MSKVLFSSTNDKDMLYAVGLEISDPFFLIDTKEGRFIFLDHRELGLFQERNRDSGIAAVLLNPLLKEAEVLKESTTLINKIALLLFSKYGLLEKPVQVPRSFPLDMADFLRSKGALLVPTSPFFPERAKKTREEVKWIEESVKKTQKAFSSIEEILKESTVRGDSVVYQGRQLTSEIIKREVEFVLLNEGAVSEQGIIVSSGPQSAIPHHPGAGPILPGSPIVCDIFPKSKATGYFSDLTRTFVKGKPSLELERMQKAVLRAQDCGLKMLRPGVRGSDVHKAVAKVLLEAGFDVGDKGFVHGTGHGVGLEVHENPYFNERYSQTLDPGNVVTIEPGLYYPKLGGVRIEDMALITRTGVKMLSSYPNTFVIP